MNAGSSMYSGKQEKHGIHARMHIRSAVCLGYKLAMLSTIVSRTTH